MTALGVWNCSCSGVSCISLALEVKDHDSLGTITILLKSLWHDYNMYTHALIKQTYTMNIHIILLAYTFLASFPDPLTSKTGLTQGTGNEANTFPLLIILTLLLLDTPSLIVLTSMYHCSSSFPLLCLCTYYSKCPCIIL